MKNILKILLSFFAFCLFTFAVIQPLNMAGNWYQQFLPNINGRTIVDVTFTDSLTGYAVTSLPSLTDTAFILKTTNGGDNWVINHRDSAFIFRRIQFINQNTGFAGGTHFMKTTNAGANWQILSQSLFFDDMYVLNNDTAWFAKTENLTGGVFRSINGGANWQNQLNIGSTNPDHVYMYNARIGFIARGNFYLRKTTNSGQTWDLISGAVGFTDIYFSDSLNGWKNNGTGTIFQKTSNGGLNWVTYNLPPETGIIILSRIRKFHNIVKDTIYGVGAQAFLGPSQSRGLIYKSTDGGQTWGYQLPDTSIHSAQYQNIQFISKNHGWAYWPSGGVHTTNGGDTTWYTGLQNTSTEIPKKFELAQNYPNPFNPKTIIPFSLKQAAFVQLIAYDITGKEIQVMVNEQLHAGEYEADFMGKFTSSGVYFYKLTVNTGKEVYTETKKMMLIK